MIEHAEKMIEHAEDMLEKIRLTNNPAKIAKAQALLDRIRQIVNPSAHP